MQRRDELEGWIASSRRVQRKLKLGIPVAVVVSIILLAISRPAGGIALAIVSLVALSGFWITGGHIADWQEKLHKLDHPVKPGESKRRYQSD